MRAQFDLYDNRHNSVTAGTVMSGFPQTNLSIHVAAGRNMTAAIVGRYNTT